MNRYAWICTKPVRFRTEKSMGFYRKPAKFCSWSHSTRGARTISNKRISGHDN